MKASALRRHGSIVPKGAGVSIGPLHPAHASGRSIFSSRVYDPDEVARVLKTGHQSRKIGRQVAKGHRRGWPIFTLTLEERATCPRTCEAWAYCYGNHMQAAERITPGPALETALWAELSALQADHPRGFMVRLHVLGDFYSEAYVRMWSDALAAFPALHVFGFTARLPGTPIGDALQALWSTRWDRFAVRVSGMAGALKAAQVIPNTDAGAITCPAQTEATDCCATCALCWQSDRTIAFARH